MPPSPQEIKARLDKVVDQEGNVLDMASVLEIVSVLEKITITKEALEATRIGRVINLMRKKTKNEDLARRAKRLVKKWQKLVSNHFKNLAKAAELPGNGNSGTSTPTSQINGIIKEQEERPKSCSEIPQKKGVKRRRTSVSAESSPLSEKDLIKPDILIQEKNDNGSNEWNNELVHYSDKTFRNGCLDNLAVDINGKQIVGSDSYLDEKNRHEIETPKYDESQSSCNDHNDQDDNWIAVPESSAIESKAVADIGKEGIAQEPISDIPEEVLQVVRRQLPENCVDPSTEADGINGCYNQDGIWSSWSENVSNSSRDLSILPYVTLE